MSKDKLKHLTNHIYLSGRTQHTDVSKANIRLILFIKNYLAPGYKLQTQLRSSSFKITVIKRKNL